MKILWLSFNNIKPIGIQHLVKHDWENLEKLHLAGNHFGPEGALALSKGNFPKL